MRYFLLLLLLVSCAQIQSETAPNDTIATQEPVDTTPTIPTEPESAVIDTTPQEVAPVEAGHEKIWGVFTKQGPFHNITCDPNARVLTFTIENPTNLTWQLDKELPFPQPKGMTTVAFTYNSLEINKRGGNSFNGEMIFWQGEKFSEVCTGDALLTPGESTTCTLHPVPFKKNDSFDAGTNELNVNAPDVYYTLTFRCG